MGRKAKIKEISAKIDHLMHLLRGVREYIETMMPPNPSHVQRLLAFEQRDGLGLLKESSVIIVDEIMRLQKKLKRLESK